MRTHRVLFLAEIPLGIHKDQSHFYLDFWKSDISDVKRVNNAKPA
jgi:hypothetical protein